MFGASTVCQYTEAVTPVGHFQDAPVPSWGNPAENEVGVLPHDLPYMEYGSDDSPGTVCTSSDCFIRDDCSVLDAEGSGQPEVVSTTPVEVWERMRAEAQASASAEPMLAPALHALVISHASFGAGLAHLLGSKLADSTLLGSQICGVLSQLYEEDPSLVDAAKEDLEAVVSRDPGCPSHAHCLLYGRGFQALQAHRAARGMWSRGRRALALALYARVCEVYSVDIHPAARLGRGILLPHATGIVIGWGVVVGDGAILFQSVTLGGAGTVGESGDRPVVGPGVVLGAGCSVLGPITIGAGARIAPQSCVLDSVPAGALAVGVDRAKTLAVLPSIVSRPDLDGLEGYGI